MKQFVVEDPAELKLSEKSIFSLFNDSFGFPLSQKVWEWAYINNPSGHPVVALAYDNERLVGHYAAIPFPLKNGKGQTRDAFLSMTTMVHPEYRKYGLFVKLAEMAYEVLKRREADLVCGFPNSMSAPGFKKRLGWKLDEPSHLIKTSKEIILRSMSEVPALSSSCSSFYLDMSSSVVKNWRFSRPDVSYDIKDGLVTKTFGDEIDLIYLESRECLANLPDGKDINILVPDSAFELKRFSSDAYMFGFRALSERSLDDEFAQQMFMSDVF